LTHIKYDHPINLTEMKQIFLCKSGSHLHLSFLSGHYFLLI